MVFGRYVWPFLVGLCRPGNVLHWDLHFVMYWGGERDSEGSYRVPFSGH